MPAVAGVPAIIKDRNRASRHRRKGARQTATDRILSVSLAFRSSVRAQGGEDPTTAATLPEIIQIGLDQAVGLVPAGRRLLFLEGGYDLQALAHSTGAVLSALVDDGAYRPEPATSGGPGAQVVADALNIRGALTDG